MWTGGVLVGLNLGERHGHPAVCGGEEGACGFPLCFQSKPAPALLGRRDPDRQSDVDIFRRTTTYLDETMLQTPQVVDLFLKRHL